MKSKNDVSSVEVSLDVALSSMGMSIYIDEEGSIAYFNNLEFTAKSQKQHNII